MILQPISLRRSSIRPPSWTELDLSDMQDRFESHLLRDSSTSAENRQLSDIETLLDNAEPTLFKVIADFPQPENDDDCSWNLRLEILPASDLTLSDSVKFMLQLPKNYPLAPPIVTCLSDTKDTRKCSFIEGSSVNLSLFRNDIAFWNRSYQLDVAAHALRRIFLQSDLAPWELCRCITDKERTGSRDIHCVTIGGHFASVGGRHTMEDSFAMQEGLKSPQLEDLASSTSYYAVFDGHGGDTCSNFAANRFGSALNSALTASENNGFVDWSRALCLALWETDRAFIKSHEGRGRTGSTALCVVFNGKDRLYTANLGDSRAVLCRGSKAVELTQDCKAGRSDEVARIVATGGFITNERVRGQLAVSRALGDASYKVRGQMLVSRDAELTEIKLEENDSFFIIACDGLWDVMTSQEAVDFVNKILLGVINPSMELVAKELVLHCVEVLGATDNVSAIVVKVDPANSHLTTPRNDAQNILSEVDIDAVTPPIHLRDNRRSKSGNIDMKEIFRSNNIREAFPLNGDVFP